MNLRKFRGSTMKDALDQVKRELGADAMVISTRPVRSGLLGSAVEVTVDVTVDEPVVARDEAPRRAAPAPVFGPETLEPLLQPIRAELRSLRNAVRGGDGAGALRQEIESLRHAIAGLGSSSPRDPREALARISPTDELARPSTKRVVALIGPTGVGKTTTIAKLAARAALIDGCSVELLTLDAFRIGGEEQIRTFADLIGVPVHLVMHPEELARACTRSRAERIFVDTAGRSRNDVAELEVLKRALGEVAELELHLAVTAMTPAHEIDAWTRRFTSIGIDRLLFTKLDECDDLSQLAFAPARLGAPISWVTTGQRVPEDIEGVDRARVLELARDGFSAARMVA